MTIGRASDTDRPSRGVSEQAAGDDGALVLEQRDHIRHWVAMHPPLAAHRASDLLDLVTGDEGRISGRGRARTGRAVTLFRCPDPISIWSAQLTPFREPLQYRRYRNPASRLLGQFQPHLRLEHA